MVLGKSFLSHYATFFAKMAERKVVPFDEFYYQLKLMYLFQKHPVFSYQYVPLSCFWLSRLNMLCYNNDRIFFDFLTFHCQI
jgi:hypothetical protein